MNIPLLSRTAPLLALALAVAPGNSLGSGTRIGFKDAFASGRGNAFVATADNPSAIYYNPAGILQQKGSRLSASGYVVRLESEFRSPGGSETSLEEDWVLLPQLFFVHADPEKPYAVGLGAYVPFGLKTAWPEESGFRTLSTLAEQRVYTINPVAAWQISPTLAIGGGPTFNRVQTDLRRGIGFFPGDEIRFSGHGDAVGYHLGLLWQPHERHSFGLSYQSHLSADLSGSTDAAPFFTGDPTTANFVFPEYIIVGYSFRPAPEWNLEVNVDWTNWDRFDSVTLRKASGDIPLVFNWKSGFFYEVGATRYLPAGYHWSAGYLYVENSVPEETFLPAIPDSNRHFFCLGVGSTGMRLRWNIAVQYGYSDARVISRSFPSLAGETANGEYKTTISAVAASLDYSF